MLDVALLFQDFRNIDLYYQGHYHLKVSLSHLDPAGRVTQGMPYYAQPENSQSHIDDKAMTFSTRSFNVRFCEEEIEIDDMVHFRVEVPVTKDSLASEVLMTVVLLFK